MSNTNAERNATLQNELREEAEFTRNTAFGGGNDRGEADSTQNFRLNPGAATARSMSSQWSGGGLALLIGVVLSIAAGVLMFGRQLNIQGSRSGSGQRRSPADTRTRDDESGRSSRGGPR